MRLHTTEIIMAASVIIFAFALSGCGYTQQFQKNLIHLPDAQITPESLTVYAVEFEGFDDTDITDIWVGKFGVRLLDDKRVEITHGQADKIEINEISAMLSAEMEMQLKRNGYNSIKDFIKTYSTGAPLFPGSEYRAVPPKLGWILLDIAERSDHDIPEPDQNP